MKVLAISILVVTLVLLAYVCRELYAKKSLFKKVGWCVAHSRSVTRPILLLWLNDTLAIKNIKSDYMITKEDERLIAQEILRIYQEELKEKYFKGIAPYYGEATCEEYFLSTFIEFLSRHECETDFNRNVMYKVKSYKNCGCYGVDLFEATYELTDYAVVYHKLYYNAQLCYENDPRLNKYNHCTESARIKKVIETREIEVSKY